MATRESEAPVLRDEPQGLREPEIDAVGAARHRLVILAAIGLDLAATGLAYFLAALQRFTPARLLEALSRPGGIPLLAGVAFLWLAALSARDCYAPSTLVDTRRQVVRLVTAAIPAWILTHLLAFLLKMQVPFESRLVMGLSLPLAIALLLAVRLAVVRPLARGTYRRLARGPILVLGDGPRAERIARESEEEHGGRRVVLHPLPFGAPEEARRLVERGGFGVVVIEPAGLGVEETFDVAFSCLDARADVQIASSRFQVLTGRSAIGDLDGVPVMRLRRGDLAGPEVALKRLVDIVGSAVGLLLLSPALAALALAVRATSPGPALFRQERVGRRGRRFVMYKFRTMGDGNDPRIHRDYLRSLIQGGAAAKQSEDGTRIYKLTGDPRVTRVGAWLRRYSLDELPQLWNVLVGDMSLVGPRPCLPYEWDLYRPWQRRRLDVLPGCTGLWQVTARSYVSFEEMVILDLHYAHRWTVGGDLGLILQTVPAMVTGKGGY